jgi:transposase-like protein
VNDETSPDQARVAEDHGEQPDDTRDLGLIDSRRLAFRGMPRKASRHVKTGENSRPTNRGIQRPLTSGAEWPISLRPQLPKLAAFLDQAETDVLAFMSFPKDHRPKIHSTNPLQRPIGEIKRRTDVVGIFPNEEAITRLVGAILLEQNDEWAVQRARYMTLETIAPLSDDPIVLLPAVAA